MLKRIPRPRRWGRSTCVLPNGAAAKKKCVKVVLVRCRQCLRALGMSLQICANGSSRNRDALIVVLVVLGLLRCADPAGKRTIHNTQRNILLSFICMLVYVHVHGEERMQFQPSIRQCAWLVSARRRLQNDCRRRYTSRHGGSERPRMGKVISYICCNNHINSSKAEAGY